MTNQKLTSKILILLISCMFCLNGCKKNDSSSNENLTDKQKIENAREWYQADAKPSLNINSNKGLKANLIIAPDWGNAQTKVIDNKTVVMTAIKTNIQKIVGDHTRFMLVVINDTEGFKSKIVNIDLTNLNKLITIDDLYYTAFTNRNITGESKLQARFKVFSHDFHFEKQINYSEAGMNTLSDLPTPVKTQNGGGKGKLAETVIVTICTDWYVVYPDQSTQYLGRTCEDTMYETTIDWIAPEIQGANNTTCTEASLAIDAQIESVDGGSSASVPSGSPATVEKIEKLFTWKFLRHAYGDWWYNSTEKGIAKKVNGDWQWESLKNHQVGLNGTTIAVLDLKTTHQPTVGIYNAGMAITFEFHGTVVCKGFPIANHLATTVHSPIWNISKF